MGKWSWFTIFILLLLGGYFYYVRGWDYQAFQNSSVGRLIFEREETVSPDEPVAGTRWQTMRPMLTSRSEIGAAIIGEKIYVVGGIDAYARTLRSMEIYDIATDTWSNGPPMPQALHHPAVTTDGEKLYVLGGLIGISFETVDTGYVFDPATSQWSEMPRLGDFRGAAMAGVLEGNVYLAGGVDLTGPTNGVLKFDTEKQSWGSIASMSAPREHLAGAVLDGKLYAIAGRTHFPDGNVDALEVYDPATGAWLGLAPIPTPRSGFGAASVNDRIYVFGGEGPNGTIKNVEVYVPEFDSWQPFGEIPTARHGVTAVAHENRIYVLGGGKRVGYSVSNLNEVLIIE